MRILTYLTIAFTAFACADDEPTGLVPGVSPEVATIRLQQTYRSNSKTIMANGISSTQFDLLFLNSRGVPVLVPEHPMEVWVNGRTKLPYPYIFTTTQTGTYQFSLRVNDGTVFSENSGTITAFLPPELESYRLPIVFHYFNEGAVALTADEKRTIAKFYTDSLNLVNDAYANRRGSQDPNAIDARIEFYLATEDPDGAALEFPGFEFVHAPGLTTEWDDLDRQVRDGHNWPPTHYINVWLVTLDGLGGFAFYPEYEPTGTGYPTSLYGTFIQREINVPGTTLAHELGHMLDLRHVFGSDCLSNDDCEDTHGYWRTAENWNKGSELIRTDCDYELFAATNYMDYFAENTTFTRDQIVRMHKAVKYSPFLPTERNMQAGGRKHSAREKIVLAPSRSSRNLVGD